MSKLRKFRLNPTLFFADSKSAALRFVGQALAPLIDSTGFRRMALHPAESLEAIPVVGPISRRFRMRRERDVRTAISRADRPLISIVMAAHNAEKTIGAAIGSLLEQTYGNFELIVVDDASTDSTAQRVLDHSDSRVTLRSLESNVGAANARNVGISAARGKWLAFQDADDTSEPRRLEAQLGALLQQKSAVVCVCSSRREDESGAVVRINDRLEAKAVISMMFERERVVKQVGFFRSLPVSEDAEYYERIKAVFGDESEIVLLDCFLSQLFRAESLLFGDGNTSIDAKGHVHHTRSTQAEQQWQEVLAQLKAIRAGRLSPYVGFSDESVCAG